MNERCTGISNVACSPGLLPQTGCGGKRKMRRRNSQRMLFAFRASQGGLLQPGREVTQGRSTKSQLASRKGVRINYLLFLSRQEFRAVRRGSRSQFQNWKKLMIACAKGYSPVELLAAWPVKLRAQSQCDTEGGTCAVRMLPGTAELSWFRIWPSAWL